jgi:two-component system sensor histidine kinase KdpD
VAAVSGAGRRRRDDDARSDFLAAVIHDLRAPLTCVVGFGSTLAERWPDLSDEDRAAFLRRIVLNGHELDRRITNFLEYSRLDRGAPTLECRPRDLGAAVAAAVDRTRLVLERHLVIVAVPDDMIVVGDDDAITRVLENLLGNAAKYAPRDTVVRVIGQRTRRGILVSVEDDGPGVPPEDAKRIFEPFYRAADGRGASGAGIGLAGVRQLVTLMGGDVWVEAPPNGGSRFCFTLEAASCSTPRISRTEPVAFLHSAR